MSGMRSSSAPACVAQKYAAGTSSRRMRSETKRTAPFSTHTRSGLFPAYASVISALMSWELDLQASFATGLPGVIVALALFGFRTASPTSSGRPAPSG